MNADEQERIMKQNDKDYDDWVCVVRCKDCNNSYIAEDGNRICTQDDYTGIIVTDNDYCSYGERRAE